LESLQNIKIQALERNLTMWNLTMCIIIPIYKGGFQKHRTIGSSQESAPCPSSPLKPPPTIHSPTSSNHEPHLIMPMGLAHPLAPNHRTHPLLLTSPHSPAYSSSLSAASSPTTPIPRQQRLRAGRLQCDLYLPTRGLLTDNSNPKQLGMDGIIE